MRSCMGLTLVSPLATLASLLDHLELPAEVFIILLVILASRPDIRVQPRRRPKVPSPILWKDSPQKDYKRKEWRWLFMVRHMISSHYVVVKIQTNLQLHSRTMI